MNYQKWILKKTLTSPNPKSWLHPWPYISQSIALHPMRGQLCPHWLQLCHHFGGHHTNPESWSSLQNLDFPQPKAHQRWVGFTTLHTAGNFKGPVVSLFTGIKQTAEHIIWPLLQVGYLHRNWRCPLLPWCRGWRAPAWLFNHTHADDSQIRTIPLPKIWHQTCCLTANC